jgi:hypothetical protein
LHLAGISRFGLSTDFFGLTGTAMPETLVKSRTSLSQMNLCLRNV